MHNATSRGTDRSLPARNQLVTDHMNLVKAIARNVAGTLPSHVEIEDLVQAGYFGLIDAADRFDLSKGIAFPTYAKFRIRGAVLDYLRTQDWASREFRFRERKVAQAEGELTAALKRTPSDEELAAHLDMDLDRVRQTRQAATIRRPHSTDSCHETLEPESRPQEIAGKTDDRPDVIAARSETAEALRGAVEALPRRYRSLITMYYEGDLTMKEIGRELGVNESRVSQIHRAALAKLSDTLASRGLSAEVLYDAA